MTSADDARSHAVVLGASMAGLLAARVLAESFERVSVVDRDVMPPVGQHRRGVPQGRHLHALLARGAEVLDELFPGLLSRLVEHGAARGDVLANGRWQLSGHRLRQAESGLVGIAASRPFLEGHVREAVTSLPNVTFVEGHDVGELLVTPDGCRVTGVRVAPHDGTAAPVPLSADLVVDATGRGSRTPAWLRRLGFPVLPEDRVEVRVGYVSRFYRLRPGALGTDDGVVTGAMPGRPRGGTLVAVEGSQHIVSLSGLAGHHPSTDPEGFEAFAADLAFPDIAEALRGAEPLTDPVAFRFPASIRRRYERLADFPRQFLVIGDAVCSFNPVYGQGMTVAALEALALRRLLQRGSPDARRWFREVARVVDVPWTMAAGGDLAFPQVPGRRTARIRLVNTYMRHLHAAAAVDPELAVAFVRVAGLVDRPGALLRPDRVARVLRSGLTTSERPRTR